MSLKHFTTIISFGKLSLKHFTTIISFGKLSLKHFTTIISFGAGAYISCFISVILTNSLNSQKKKKKQTALESYGKQHRVVARKFHKHRAADLRAYLLFSNYPFGLELSLTCRF